MKRSRFLEVVLASWSLASGVAQATPAGPVVEPRVFVNWVFGAGQAQRLFQAGLQLQPSPRLAESPARAPSAGAAPAWLDFRLAAQGASLNLAGQPIARSVLLREATDGSAVAPAAQEPWYRNGWALGAAAVSAAVIANALGSGHGGGSASASGPAPNGGPSTSGSVPQGTCAEVAGTTVGVGGGDCAASAP